MSPPPRPPGRDPRGASPARRIREGPGKPGSDSERVLPRGESPRACREVPRPNTPTVVKVLATRTGRTRPFIASRAGDLLRMCAFRRAAGGTTPLRELSKWWGALGRIRFDTVCAS